VPEFIRVKKWPSCEKNNIIFVWYHAEGEEPTWHVSSIPEIQNGQFWYRGRNEFVINSHIQVRVDGDLKVKTNLNSGSLDGCTLVETVALGKVFCSYFGFPYQLSSLVKFVPSATVVCRTQLNMFG
jgi:hypothetical protein